MARTLHLTTPEGEAMARMIAATSPGMAHYAGSGPDGATCRDCAFWSSSYGYKRDPEGRLRRRRCRKYISLMGGG